MSPLLDKWLNSTLAELLAVAETKPGKILDIKTASRGPCSYCGKPVVWHQGLRNWFGELVHHTCAGK